jgi:peptidoglycan glycosyltransferase
MNMNNALKRTSIAATFLIVLAMINLNYLQGSQADKLQKNPLNARQYTDIFNHPRGQILAGNEVLAYSQPSDGPNGKSKKYQRFYGKDGAIFFPVTGYFASTGLTTGIEQSYNGMLNGTDKQESPQSWFDSFVGKQRKGANVYTTIDPQAQKIAYKKLGDETDRRGAAVVMDISTGAIKVAASYPAFDPNSVAGTNDGKQANDSFTKEQKKLSMAGDLNRAYNELFPPGSSFKSVVAATALENGFTKDTSVPAPYQAPIPQSTLLVSNDSNSPPCNGNFPLIDTFAASCNTAYALLGQQTLGPQKVETQAEKFQFAHQIEVEPGLKSAASSYPYKEPAPKVFLGSFGQGETKATPLQMAMVAAAIGSGDGTIMKPYMVQNVKTVDGNDLYTANPSEIGPKAIGSNTAGQLQDMMRAVVNSPNGTATNLQGDNIAGKTGTAELSGNNRGLWFVGFAPADKPKIAFAVMIEGTKGDFGATKSGPVAAAIVKQVLADEK